MSKTSQKYDVAKRAVASRRHNRSMLDFWYTLEPDEMSLFDGFPDLMAAVDMVDRTTVHSDHVELDLTA